MTREYILQNLEGACPIWFIDNPQLRDEVMATLQDSLLIPKPKFKVGDKLKRICSEDWEIYVWRAQYDLSEKVWIYYESYDDYYEEDELELVEEGK